MGDEDKKTLDYAVLVDTMEIIKVADGEPDKILDIIDPESGDSKMNPDKAPGGDKNWSWNPDSSIWEIKPVSGNADEKTGTPDEIGRIITSADMVTKIETALETVRDSKAATACEVLPEIVDNTVPEKPEIDPEMKDVKIQLKTNTNPMKRTGIVSKDFDRIKNHYTDADAGGRTEELTVEEFVEIGGHPASLEPLLFRKAIALSGMPNYLNPVDSDMPGEILPKDFSKIISLAKIRQNILLVGPSGCGKTYLSSKVAEKLELPFGSQSCSAGMSESMLAGYLIPIGNGGKFEYVSSIFTKLYEEGGVFLLDELDAADENTLVFINQALANGSFYLSQRYNKREFVKHSDFIAIAAANTYGHGESMTYSGRNQLDGATLDRFRAGVVKMDFSDKVEEALVDPEILTWGREVRRFIKDKGFYRIMSTRVLIDFTRQKKELGWGMKEFKDSYFSDWNAGDRSQAEAVRIA